MTQNLIDGDELTERSTGHIWEVTSLSLKGGLPHFTIRCKHPGRSDAALVLCESGLLMRFDRLTKATSLPASLQRFTRLVRSGLT